MGGCNGGQKRHRRIALSSDAVLPKVPGRRPVPSGRPGPVLVLKVSGIFRRVGTFRELAGTGDAGGDAGAAAGLGGKSKGGEGAGLSATPGCHGHRGQLSVGRTLCAGGCAVTLQSCALTGFGRSPGLSQRAEEAAEIS